MPSLIGMVRRLGEALMIFNSYNSLRKVTNDGSVCLQTPLTWKANNGRLTVNGQYTYHLKGISWFGLETDTYAPHGLQQRTIDDLFRFLQENKFNGLRVPFSLQYALSPDEKVWYNFREDWLRGKTRMELMEIMIDKAAEYNILVMLDMHRLNDQFIPQLWYDQNYSEDDVLRGWDIVLGRFKTKWNVFAIDLKNEPYGVATWGTNNKLTDWDTAAMKIGKHILTEHSDWQGLLFVEGINYSTDFRMQKSKPITFGGPAVDQRIVWSPHQYGPSVVDLEMFKNETFPDNLPPVWESYWGFMQKATGQAVVLGEWGGRYTDKDKIWQDKFTDWLIDQCHSNQFYWSLNPDSGDTGGLLADDWWNPMYEKIAVVTKVQPNPSFFTAGADGKVCLQLGEFANPKCK